MAIAFVVQRYGTEVAGGAEALCRDTARALVRAGEEVTIYTTTARDYLTWAPYYPEGTTDDDGVEVRRFAVNRPDPDRSAALVRRLALNPGDLLTTAIGGPMVHVARSIVRARGEGAPTVKSTKSGANRLVPLAHLAADVAQTWANGKDRQALLVPGPDGSSLRPSTFRRQVHWTQTVPARFRIHDLRHTCATNLLVRMGRTSSACRASSATPAPTPPCATTATSPAPSTCEPPWTTTSGPSPRGVRPSGAPWGRLGRRNQRLTTSRTGRDPSNTNGFPVEPPRGFEPRTYALRAPWQCGFPHGSCSAIRHFRHGAP